MSGAVIEAVVFDVGNVIVEWNRDLLYRDVIPDDERRAWFFDHASGAFSWLKSNTNYH